MPSIISIGATAGSPGPTIVEPTVLVVGLPSPRSTDDWMLCWTDCKKPTASFTYPVGWQVIYDVAGATCRHGLLAYRVDGAEAEPTITWSGLTTGAGGSTSHAIIVNVGTGFHESGAELVIDVVGVVEDGASHATDVVGGEITTLTDGAILFSQGLRLSSTASTIATYAGASGLLFEKIVTDLIANGGALLAMEAWATQDVAGDTDNQSTITGGSGSFVSSGVIVAIQPTPPPPAEQTEIIEYTLTQ